MHSLLAIAYTALLTIVAGFSLWLATVDYRRGRLLSRQSAAAWPLEFPVFWLEYYLGPWLARCLRVGQVVLGIPIIVLNAHDAIVRDGAPQGSVLLYATVVGVLAVRTYVPMICRLDDQGVLFEHRYRWNAIRRWKLGRGRLLLVAERHGPQQIVSHIEIPLNGLPPALLPWLEEQMTARVGHPAMPAA
jgi:hypothetical protein